MAIQYTAVPLVKSLVNAMESGIFTKDKQKITKADKKNNEKGS